MKRKTINRNRALRLIARQEGRCGICGRNMADVDVHIDHIIPISHPRGSNAESNLQVVCASCNLAKGNSIWTITPEIDAAGQIIIRRRYEPDNDPFLDRLAALPPSSTHFADGGASWLAEAQKRFYATALTWWDLIEAPTWDWNPQMFSELMEMPELGESGEAAAIWPDVAEGVHIFRWADTYSSIAAQNPADPSESALFMVAALVIFGPEAMFIGIDRRDEITGPRQFARIDGPEPLKLAAKVSALLQQKLIVGAQLPALPRSERRRDPDLTRLIDETTSIRAVKWRKIERRDDRSAPRRIAEDFWYWVSGHWRRQWYPGAQQHRYRYIESHRKGNIESHFRAPRRAVNRVIR